MSTTSPAARGLWFLSRKTSPKASRAADGTFALTLLVFDRQGPHTVEPWRVTWSGNDAFDFWSIHAHQLQPGVALYMVLDKLRCFSAAGKHSSAEFQANVNSLQVVTKDANSAQSFKTNQALAHA